MLKNKKYSTEMNKNKIIIFRIGNFCYVYKSKKTRNLHQKYCKWIL